MQLSVLTNQKRASSLVAFFQSEKTRPGGTGIERAKLKTVVHVKIGPASKWHHLTFDSSEEA